MLSKNSIDAIWTLDAETLKYEYMTDSIEKISGFTADEYINVSATERLTPKSLEKISSLLVEELPKYEKGIKNVRSTDVQLVHKNGKKYWVRIKARFFKEADGRLKIMGVTREISDLKRLENQKKKLSRDLKALKLKYKKMVRENKVLKQLIPVCSGCNKYCDVNGNWWNLNDLEVVLRNENSNEFAKHLCNDCRKE